MHNIILITQVIRCPQMSNINLLSEQKITNFNQNSNVLLTAEIKSNNLINRCQMQVCPMQLFGLLDLFFANMSNSSDYHNQQGTVPAKKSTIVMVITV